MILGPYQILDLIGEGGMGVVYRARDPRLDRQVAIKLLRAGMAADPLARERLRQEAMSAAALDHPYICKIFEIGEHDDGIFLVMEYIAGETLHHRLQAGRMPLPEILRVAGEIGEALQAAHAAGFLHRDLKPANIMLTGQGHVKVMDFGLAKRLGQALSADAPTVEIPAQLTVPGTILGTPDYMSPEQVKGLPLDVRSDLFSFGVILAEMLSGKHPFHQPSVAETLSAVLHGPPELSSDIPPGWMAIVQRLLAKAAGDRCASIADMRAELARLDSYQAPVEEKPRQSATPRRWKRALAVLAILAFLAVAYFIARPTLMRSRAIRSIAVLPLDNYSRDPSQEYFAEGMTDELTSDLATISQLRVISRGSVMQFKGDHRPPTPEIAKLLNVDAIVEGSVVRDGDKVRITAQLIDARIDKHLWSKRFERRSIDVLALQDELASAIAREIHVQLTPTEKSRLASAPSVNPEAHDAYLKGRFFFNRPSDENLQKAIAQFEAAVRLDSSFVPAYSGLSDAYLWAGYNEGFITAADAKPKAKAAAEKAIALDDTSAEAHTSLAVFKFFYEFDWRGSEVEFRRAFALNPSYAFAHDQFGLALAFQGRFEESVAEGKLASELDPLSPQIPVDSIFGLVWQNKETAARQQIKRASDLDPTFFFVPFGDAWLDFESGKTSAVIPKIQKAKAMGAPVFISAWLGYAFGASGDKIRAAAEIEDLKKRSLHGYVAPFNLALVYLGMGDRARALDYLDQAYAASSQWLAWLNQDRIFDPLRSEPRFVALLKKLRFEK